MLSVCLSECVCVCVCECENCSLEVLIKVTADCLYDWDLEWRGLQWLDLWGKTLTLLSVEGCGSNGVGVSMKWTVFVCVCDYKFNTVYLLVFCSQDSEAVNDYFISSTVSPR